jgi:hypothetical protein
MGIARKSIPDLGLYVFWDIDKSKLDFVSDRDFIISRLFERGKLDDVLKVISYYGIPYTKKSLAANKYLSRQGIYLAKALLDIPIEHFSAYAALKHN